MTECSPGSRRQPRRFDARLQFARLSALSGSDQGGSHTGEYKLIGDEFVGIAIHIGARIAGKAGASEVLVSSTVRDLVSDSGIGFKDRGVHRLKGVPEKMAPLPSYLESSESR